jgi:TATA-box binding protein (TBP) (component of TFIID and TFIIIB)
MNNNDIDDLLNNNILNNAMNKYLHKLNEIDKVELNIPKPTPLRISTRSAISEISAYINLANTCSYFTKKIIENIDKKNNINYPIRGVVMKNFVYTMYGKNIKNNISADKIEEELELLKGVSRDHFYNSCTIIIKLSDIKHVNIKLFSNGNISMTGCKENSDGSDVVNILLNEMKKNKECFINTDILTEEELTKYKKSKKCGEKINGYIYTNDVKVTKYDITMINSDFKLNFTLDKDKLYDVILNQSNLITMYEDHYAGVKIYYYWNMFNENNNGICKCDPKLKCNGRNNGTGEARCKKITIICFQTGSVIITGARNEMQINHAYNDIIKILHENYNKIIRISITDFLDLDYCNNEEIPLDDIPIDENFSKNNIQSIEPYKKIKIKIKKIKKELPKKELPKKELPKTTIKIKHIKK